MSQLADLILYEVFFNRFHDHPSVKNDPRAIMWSRGWFIDHGTHHHIACQYLEQM